MSSNSPQSPRLTLKNLRAMHDAADPITMLTAYDAVTARILDEAGVDLLLVGDSLGNVVLGFENTIPVTLDDMIRHTAAVVRGTRRALVICDLPFGTYPDPDTALRNAIRVFQETGCQAVKLEGGALMAPIVRRLVSHGIPVMGHIGLTPQSVHQLGGYFRHGKTAGAAHDLRDAGRALEEAGAFSVVLECIMPDVATQLTEELDIPTIGIGSGTGCAGQVLVVNDVIGLSVTPPPSFARPRANVAAIIREAAAEFVREVKSGPADAGLRKDVAACPAPVGSSSTSETLTP